MGAMRKMAVYLGLVEDEGLEYADHEDDYVDPRSRHDEARSYSSVREVRPEPTRSSGHRPVAPVPATRGALATDTAVAPSLAVSEPVAVSHLYRITTRHPRTYNDARRIGEECREGVPVILTLTDMDDVDAKRLVD